MTAPLTQILDAVKRLRALINLDQSPLVRAVDRDNRRQIEDCLETIEAGAGARPSPLKSEDPDYGFDVPPAEAHMHDLYTALGIKWGDDPFPIIEKLLAGARPSGAPAPEGWAIEIAVSHYHDGTRDNEASHYCGSLDEANAREIFARLDATAKPLLDAALKAAAARPLEEPRPTPISQRLEIIVAWLVGDLEEHGPGPHGSVQHRVDYARETLRLLRASGPRDEPPTPATTKNEKNEGDTRVDSQ